MGTTRKIQWNADARAVRPYLSSGNSRWETVSSAESVDRKNKQQVVLLGQKNCREKQNLFYGKQLVSLCVLFGYLGLTKILIVLGVLLFVN